MGKVTIEFRGICTHFFGVAPGVPHRVVLPRADGFRIGFIEVGGAVTPYCLPPHLSYVYCTDSEFPIEGPGILAGWIVAGVRLEIANAVGAESTGRSDAGLPHLRDYAFDYRVSHDVVRGGRAQCYFDLFRGSVGVRQVGEAKRGVATIETDGPPRLRIEPFDWREPAREITIGSHVIVGNTSLGCKDASLDFLLHLLTDERGIPERLPCEPLGFDATRVAVPRERLMERLGELLDLGYPTRPARRPEEIFEGDYETDPSCSNSQWP